MKSISLRLPDEMVEDLERVCAELGCKHTPFIMNVLRAKLDEAKSTITGFSLYGPLPPVAPSRVQIQLWPSDDIHERAQYNATLACWLPDEWHEYLTDLGSVNNRSVASVVMERIRRYMDDDGLVQYAKLKGWPMAYAKRHLINHVFPELPYCDFGPAPARRAPPRKRRT